MASSNTCMLTGVTARPRQTVRTHCRHLDFPGRLERDVHGATETVSVRNKRVAWQHTWQITFQRMLYRYYTIQCEYHQVHNKIQENTRN